MDNQNNYSNNNYNNVNGYYFTGGNNQPVNTPPDNYKKGIKVGMAVGALSVLIVCAIAAAIFFAVRFTKTGSIGGNKLVLGDDVVKKVNDIMSLIDKNYLFEYDSDQLKEYVYKGLVKGLGDQYSDYYTAEEYKMLTQRNDGVAFYGVNLVYTYDENTNQFVVQEVDPEGPAGKAGIQSGDVIIKIDGEDITNKNLTNLSDYIRGEEGSEVSMTVLRNGASLDFKINRAAVESRNVTAYVCKGDVGYMYIAHFDAALFLTSEEIRAEDLMCWEAFLSDSFRRTHICLQKMSPVIKRSLRQLRQKNWRFPQLFLLMKEQPAQRKHLQDVFRITDMHMLSGHRATVRELSSR